MNLGTVIDFYSSLFSVFQALLITSCCMFTLCLNTLKLLSLLTQLKVTLFTITESESYSNRNRRWIIFRVYIVKKGKGVLIFGSNNKNFNSKF